MNGRTCKLLRRAASAAVAQDPKRKRRQAIRALKRAWRATSMPVRWALRDALERQVAAWMAVEAELASRGLPGTTTP